MYIDPKVEKVVLLFGAGSLGANTAINLGRRFSGDIHFIIVDDDVIEDVNLANQPWFTVNVGQKKASVLCTNLYLTSKTTSTPVITRVTSATSFLHLVSSIKDRVTVCTDCFDNVASRIITQSIGCSLNVPVLHAGFSETIFFSAWNSEFPLKETSKERRPVCDRRDLGTVVTLGASMTAHMTALYMNKGIMKGSFIELSDTGITV